MIFVSGKCIKPKYIEYTFCMCVSMCTLTYTHTHIIGPPLIMEHILGGF